MAFYVQKLVFAVPEPPGPPDVNKQSVPVYEFWHFLNCMLRVLVFPTGVISKVDA